MYNIEQASEKYWPEIQRIYEEGIATGHATFSKSAPYNWADWISGKIKDACLIIKRADEVVGWASLESTSTRKVYKGVAVLNIYIACNDRSQGLGEELMNAVIEVSELSGIWTLESRIFPENVSSIRMHEKCGFLKVGIRKKIGYMEFGSLKGKWRDVLLMERRSKKVGV